jgi:hypothetical protein
VGTLHQLVLDVGREEALRRVDADDRHLVRIAADVLTDEANDIGVTYSGFCQAALPHKKLGSGGTVGKTQRADNAHG